MEEKLVIKNLHGHQYGVLNVEGEAVLFDTVPVQFAKKWLDSAPGAKTLILCGENPYPKSVGYFLETVPDAGVYAPAYTQYVLKGILDGDCRIRKAVDRACVCLGEVKIALNVVTQAGRSAYLVADGG